MQAHENSYIIPPSGSHHTRTTRSRSLNHNHHHHHHHNNPLTSEPRGGIELVNPYDPSISLQLQNWRRRTVHSVEEITTSDASSTIYEPAVRSTRSSYERTRSRSRSRSRTRGPSPSRASVERPAQAAEIVRSGSPVSRRRLFGFGPLETPSAVDDEMVEIQRLDNRRESLFGTSPTRRNAMEYDLEAQLGEGIDTNDTSPTGTIPTRAAVDEESGRGRGNLSARSLFAVYGQPGSPMSANHHYYQHHRRHRFQERMSSIISELLEPTSSGIQGSPHSSSNSSPLLNGRDQNTPLRVYITLFLTFIIPQQIYLHLLLRLPYMYYSRVTQIFLDANLTLEQMTDMTLWDIVDGHPARSPPNPQLTRAYLRLKKNWEGFIDNVLREWKTLNIISGLLLSGILTIFQIDGAGTDPITRYMAFWSLISALLSLMYGCFFIIRFSNMRRVYKATEWAIEAQRNQTMFWNVWVMLAMPAIWLVWSIIAYIVCIMAFMWRVRPNDPTTIIGPRIGSSVDTAFRVFICCVLGVGIVYAILIINTLRHYGSEMDRTWSSRILRMRQGTSMYTDDEEPRNPPIQSPPIQFGEIIPPTPPQQFTQPRFSSSPPPGPSTPPFTPPRPLPSSPLAERHQPLPLYWQSFQRRSLDRAALGDPVLSASRQRLSPDIGLEFGSDRPGSPSTADSTSLQGDALGLILHEEHEHPTAASSSQPLTDHEQTVHIVREGRTLERRQPEAPPETTKSTVIYEQANGDPCFLRVEREQVEAGGGSKPAHVS